MSSVIKEEKEMQSCASCGTPGVDDIKLRKCTACYLVRYCSVKCQKEHRKQHKKECKKRAAELKDELLFRQPESSCFGDCPICCLPVSIDIKNLACIHVAANIFVMVVAMPMKRERSWEDSSPNVRSAEKLCQTQSKNSIVE